MTKGMKPPKLWTGQLLHFSWLLVLLIAVGLVWKSMGRPHPWAFWIAVGIPVLHQIWVWVAWRLELKSASISKSINFRGYLIIFFFLFAARFVSLAWLGFRDSGSLGLAQEQVVLLTLILLLPGLYAMYSVLRYFGLSRAAGGDHFEIRFREMPLVNEGIFRYTANGMYVFAFLIFWAIAIGFNSSAALAVAAFSHAYIWVHFFATEKPDMIYLYAPQKEAERLARK